MRTPMLPLVDIVRSSWLLADKSIDTPLATITNVFDFYGRVGIILAVPAIATGKIVFQNIYAEMANANLKATP